MQTPIPREGRNELKAPCSVWMKDSGGAGAETPTAPSPYQEAKGGPSDLEFGWHHEANFSLSSQWFWDGSILF